jgi:predicted DNA-binding WGR domain protein
MIPIIIRRRDPEQRMARYYMVAIQYDLWAGPVLLREWGRIGSPGRIMIEDRPDAPPPELAARHLLAVKLRRGYGHTA